MQWIDRVRTDPTLRKIIHSDSTEELVHIEEVSTNVVTNGTMVGGETLNVSEKNIGTYGEDTYDNTETYEINDLTIYEGLLYKCISAITTPENFNSSHWAQVNLLELKANTFDLANVAFSGDYDDLSNKPYTILYDNNSGGTAGNITLSDSAANYSYIEIYAHRSVGHFSQKILNPNGKTFSLTSTYYTNSIVYVYTQSNTINETSITRGVSALLEARATGNTVSAETSDPRIFIDRVVGYR